MFRRLLKEAVAAVQKGDDPMGIVRDPENGTVTVSAGNTLIAR